MNGPQSILELLQSKSPDAVLVTGTRRADLCMREWVHACLLACAPGWVVLGDCPTGVDALALEWCRSFYSEEQFKCCVTTHHAEWKGLGLRAGPVRNGNMVAHAVELRAAGYFTLVLAFPRGGPGTADCMSQARSAGLYVEEL